MAQVYVKNVIKEENEFLVDVSVINKNQGLKKSM